MSRDNEDDRITLGILKSIEDNCRTSQRAVATDLGIALGLVNAYLKRCIKKGCVKVQQAPANRYAYYLTPKGFSEKSRLTMNYLSRSMQFFRESRQQCGDLLALCKANGWTRLALHSVSDLAEITLLCAREHHIDLVGVIDTSYPDTTMLGVPVLREADPTILDAVVITDVTRPQAVFDRLVTVFPANRVLAPAMLKITRTPIRMMDGE